MKPEAQPLVSVLTPVYNGQKYLAECIESILAQTYQNWEYVIVNNCSTDHTPEIAQTYADRDKRIHIHSNSEFVSCDQNGNIALRQISSNSKYCKVVHADDWIYPECIMKMVELAEAHPKVAIVGAYGLSRANVQWVGLDERRSIFSGQEIFRAKVYGRRYLCGTPTSMLIRSDEVRKRPTFYNEANMHCDMESCFDVLRERDFGFVHQVLTYVRVRDNEETETGFSKRFNTFILGDLEILTKYGRVYLNQGEYDQQLKVWWKRYYRFLGSKVFRNKEKAFFEYHRKELGRLGYSMSTVEIAKAVLMELIELVFNPLMTSQRLFRKLLHVAGKSSP
jgi:glycosyltransferase involved in cell wall biosynthesis